MATTSYSPHQHQHLSHHPIQKKKKIQRGKLTIRYTSINSANQRSRASFSNTSRNDLIESPDVGWHTQTSEIGQRVTSYLGSSSFEAGEGTGWDGSEGECRAVTCCGSDCCSDAGSADGGCGCGDAPGGTLVCS